jgi:hypothetical protein
MNFPKKSPSVLRASILVAGLCAAPVAWAVDYSRDIKPILSENCFSCHGFDEKGRKGKLRLDLAESAYAERNGLFRIKPRVLSLAVRRPSTPSSARDSLRKNSAPLRRPTAARSSAASRLI